MSNNGQQLWVEHFRAGGITLEETDYGHGPVFILADTDPSSYLLKIVPSRRPEDGRFLTVILNLEWSDKYAGQLADYTLRPENRRFDFAPEELSINDAGLLSAMARQQTASRVMYHCGWTLQLPIVFVEPMRKAIALATAVLPGHPNICVDEAR